MINLMYLVLMALLAMNVSQNLLKSFGSINESLNKTNHQKQIRIDNSLNDIYTAHKRDPSKKELKLIYQKSRNMLNLSKKVKNHMRDIKNILIEKAGGYDDGSVFGIPMLNQSDNIDYGMEVFEIQEHGEELRLEINTLRKNWIQLIYDLGRYNQKNISEEDIIENTGLQLVNVMPKYIIEDGNQIPWHINMVEGVPVTAIIATISQLEHTLLNSENEMINYMKSKAGIEDEFRTDLSDVLIIPDNTHPNLGDDFNINIYYGRRQSSLPIEVIIGEIDKNIKENYSIKDSNNNIINYKSIIIKEGTDKHKKWPLLKKDPRGIDSVNLLSASGEYARLLKTNKNGRANLMLAANKVGIQDFEGMIVQRKQNGDIEYQLFDKNHGASYKVANITGPAIAAIKMNVLYVGVENPLNISVPGYKDDQLTPIISNGKIYRSKYNGKSCYMAKVNKSGKVKITLKVKEKDGTENTINGMEFRAKWMLDPKTSINGQGNKMSVSQILAHKKLVHIIDQGEFDCLFKTKSYELTLIRKRGANLFEKGRGPMLNSGRIKTLIQSAKTGDNLWFSEIKVRGCDNRDRPLKESLMIKIID